MPSRREAEGAASPGATRRSGAWALGRLVVPALFISGCLVSGIPTPVPDCGPRPPSSAIQFDTARFADLAGTYRLTLVGTSRGSEGVIDTGRITLEVADTLGRYYRRGWPPVRRMYDRPLLGTYLPTTEGARSIDATVAGDTLFLGCAPGNCVDGFLIRLRIRSVSANGFWGEWEDRQEGLGRLVDSAGGWLPDPKGFYCAQRIDP
jgi:hypothetical protein